jgi:hypothetical protein
MIDAVFEHQDGYKFNQVYVGKKAKAQFLRSLRSDKATFVHAMDTDRAVVVYPSNLPEYRRMK